MCGSRCPPVDKVIPQISAGFVLLLSGVFRQPLFVVFYLLNMSLNGGAGLAWQCGLCLTY